VPQSKPPGGLQYLREARRLDERVHQDHPHLSNVPTTVQIGIGRLEVLQLGVDGSELLSQKKCLLLLREGLVYSRSNLRANFGNGKLLRQHVCDMLERQRRRLGGEKSYDRDRAGISKLFLTPDIIPE
jgi:hypothetical protein